MKAIASRAIPFQFSLCFLLLSLSVAAQSIPPERPRARPPSELTGWAEWEKAQEIFSRVEVPPAPPLSPDQALRSFKVAPGFRLELAAAEPLVRNPIFFEFDPDGRIWAIEYRGYMRDLEGAGEGDPICRIVVLEDTDEDGRADRSTAFLEGLVMPRTFAFVKGGLLVAEPPKLWFCQDTDGDLRCDSKTLVGKYGVAGNPQHTANGLAYGIDNWYHNADWEKRHRFRDGKLVEEPVLYRGQFGVSFDEFGRYVTCRESSPVEMDLIPEEYLRRNPALVKAAQRSRNRADYGLTVPIARNANECFPIRPTPCITLGALELRSDGTLRTYTIVAGTGVYLGDQWPADAYGNIFVPEAGGHLIGRLRVSEDIERRASRYYPDGQEILASTDERFRPMSIRTGPDGALYFADMYQGIIEHVIFMAPYLAEQIRERKLHVGLDMGRIYRLVSTEKKINRQSPRLSLASPAELVQRLGHPNGWHRLTAQRLLVEQRDPAIVPALEQLLRNGTNQVARLHALWTLEGLEALDWDATFAATHDAHENVRATAIRLCERWIGKNNTGKSGTFLGRLQKASRDPAPLVRLQTLLSLGALPTEAAEALAAQMILDDEAGLFRTAALSGLAGRETKFLDRLLGAPRWDKPSPYLRAFLGTLAGVIWESGRTPALSHLLEVAHAQTGSLAWRRDVLLEGLLAAAPSDLSSIRPRALEHEPALIPALLKSNDRGKRDHAYRLSELFTWPGHDSARATPAASQPLSAEHQKLIDSGREVFALMCAPCHQPHGGGLVNVAPPLNRSDWVAGSPERLARIVLHGLFGPLEVSGQSWNHAMPGFGETALTNDEPVAAVLSYIRNSWDNAAPPVEPALITTVRQATGDRTLPWTAGELLGVTGADAFALGGKAELIHPQTDGQLLLPARKAVCFGERLAYRPALDIVAPWRKENDIAAWRVHAPAAGAYEVHIALAADSASAGDQFLIETETSRVGGAVPSTGGYDQFQEHRVGELRLREGINRVLMRPAGKLRAELCDVRSLRLVPAKGK